MAALVLALLACLGAAPAPAHAAPSRKILSTASDPGRTIPGVEVLGRFPAGSWVSADSVGALALLARDSLARILFWTEAGYRERVKGLPPARRPARMAQAHGTVEDNAENEALGDLFELAWPLLRSMAKGIGRPGSAVRDERSRFDSAFRVLEALDPGTHMARWDAFTLIEGMGESLSEANDEIAALERLFPGLPPPKDTALLAARERLIHGLRQAMRPLRPGQPEPSLKRPPGVPDAWRTIYVTPYDSVVAHPLNGEESETAVRWGNGVLTTCADNRMDFVARRGLQSRIVYLDAWEFVGEVNAYDTLQWPALFQERLKPMSRARVADHLAKIQLRLIGGMTNHARYLEKSHPALAAKLRAQIPAEREELIRLWKHSPDRASRVKGWMEMGQELRFALAWARQAGWAESVPVLEKALLAVFSFSPRG